LILGGTGSYPLPPHGLQRSILHTLRYKPLNGPCLSMAVLAYSEHEGVNRHDGGVKGEINL